MSYQSHSERDLKTLRKDIQRQLDEVIAELQRRNTQEPEIRIAEELHRLQCHFDHDDKCAWYFESWDKVEKGHAMTRKRYLARAQKLLLAYESMEMILQFINDLYEWQ